jgi:diadenosine tetraphosphate (Ap4A) HIT family hydrolase
MEREFALHEQLAADTVALGRWDLSLVLLMNDQRWPWLILVPRRSETRELHQLGSADSHLLMDEIRRSSQTLEHMFRPAKINVGALGNRVPQLHVHVVARNRDDPAWPGPVWGSGPRLPYAEAEREGRVAALRRALDLD